MFGLPITPETVKTLVDCAVRSTDALVRIADALETENNTDVSARTG